jgi:thiamine kinase-like enzyme
MSSPLSPHEAIALIPGWDSRDVTITDFHGGLSNRSYLLGRGGEEYFLRLDSEQPRVFELDRVNELTVLRRASRAGLAPDIEYANPSAGVLLCRRLPGHVLNRAHLEEDEILRDICQLLRKVHELPLCGARFEPGEAAERYVSGLESHHGLHAFALRCQEVIAEVGDATEVCCCHNDVVAGNFIATPPLKLIDWEYACDNDPLFDLASLIAYHDLSTEQARFMLREYDGNDDRWQRLREQCRLYDSIQWLWLANRQVASYNTSQEKRLESLQQRIG